MTNQALKAHPLADMFPMINGEDYPAFKMDIEEHGLTDEIVLLDGLILDGRNRYRVLTELGWLDDASHFVDFNDLGIFNANGEPLSPFDYVISKNMQRRHLNESQRAMVAARAANMRQGERTDIPKRAPLNDDAPLDTTEPSANMRKVSQGDAAKLFKVSERMVNSANKVVKDAVKPLRDLVESGELAVSLAAQMATLSQPVQEKIINENSPDKFASAMKRVSRENREAELAKKQMALPLKKFGVIYADPEWEFVTRSEDGKDRSAENHYPCSPYEEIMARRVADIAADDCVLFLWATVPCLMEAICVLDAWGFAVLERDTVTNHLTINKKKARYVSQWSWIKNKVANGYWGRNRHEILLIATKGRPVAPALGTQPASVIEAQEPIEKIDISPRVDEPSVLMEAQREHSRKPDIFAEWIEKLFPNTPKIELNARRARDGWEVWGNEAPAASDDEPEIKPSVTFPTAVERDKDIRESEGAALSSMPPMVRYEGKHNDETDALIRWGYENKKPIVHICSWLGLPDEKKGIVKGRANRLGLTDPARIIENNKARGKGK